MEKEISLICESLSSIKARAVRLEDVQIHTVRDTDDDIADLSGSQVDAGKYYMMTLRILIPKADRP